MSYALRDLTQQSISFLKGAMQKVVFSIKQSLHIPLFNGVKRMSQLTLEPLDLEAMANVMA